MTNKYSCVPEEEEDEGPPVVPQQPPQNLGQQKSIVVGLGGIAADHQRYYISSSGSPSYEATPVEYEPAIYPSALKQHQQSRGDDGGRDQMMVENETDDMILFHSMLGPKHQQQQQQQYFQSTRINETDMSFDTIFYPPQQIAGNITSSYKSIEKMVHDDIAEKTDFHPMIVLHSNVQKQQQQRQNKSIHSALDRNSQHHQMSILKTKVSSRTRSDKRPKGESLFSKDILSSKFNIGSSSRGKKACFGPNGTLITIDNSQVHIEKISPVIASYLEPTPTEIITQKIIDNQMKLHLRKQFEIQEMDQMEIDNENDEDQVLDSSFEDKRIASLKAFPEEEIFVLDKILEDKNKIPKESVDNILEEIEMWSLFNILWPTNDKSSTYYRDDSSNFLLQRRELENWLMKNSKMLFGQWYQEEQTIKSLLMRNQQQEACMLAINQGNPSLATVLSQCGGGEITKPIIRTQLEYWVEYGADEYIPEDIFEIYKLCCGQQIWDVRQLDQFTTNDWLQFFAIYLWYICPNNYNVIEAVEGFQNLLIETCEQVFNSTEISFPSLPSNSISNLCVHLLKCYSCIGYPLSMLLHPTINNPDPLDYKLSWLLMKNLRQVGYICEQSLHEDICLGFAGQLENYGLYRWSIFVLQDISQPEMQQNKIRRILERNLRPKGDPRDEVFLTRKLNLSSDEIFQAKELLASKQKLWLYKMWYIFQRGLYNQAFNTLFNEVLIRSVDHTSNYQELLTFTEKLAEFESRIYDWEIKGKFLFSFLRLMAIKKSLSDRPEDSSKFLDANHISDLITEFLTAFSKFKPINQKECILLLKIVANAHKVIKLLLVVCKGLNKKIRMIGDIGMLSDHPIPIEYSKNFHHFLLNYL